LWGTTFSEAQLQGVKFWQAELYGVDFRQAHLEHAQFQGALLGRMCFADAFVLGVEWQGVDLHAAEGITPQQLASALRDAQTVSPDMTTPLAESVGSACGSSNSTAPTPLASFVKATRRD
jgi:hypothetical protein